MELLEQYHLTGLLVGLATFLIIGLFHPIVVKCEYHFGTRCWWWFLVLGFAFLTVSVIADNILWQSVAGVTAFSCFWTIREIFEQKQRVAKGWFPKKGTRDK